MVAYPDEPLRVVVLPHGRDRVHENACRRGRKIQKLVGIIALEDLLHARVRNLEEERRRERVLRIHLPFGGTVQGVSNGSGEGSSEIDG